MALKQIKWNKCDANKYKTEYIPQTVGDHHKDVMKPAERPKLHQLYYYVRNFCNLSGLEQ